MFSRWMTCSHLRSITNTQLCMTALHWHFCCFALTWLEMSSVSWQKVSRWPDSPEHWYFHYSRCWCHFILSHVYSNLYPRIWKAIHTPFSSNQGLWSKWRACLYLSFSRPGVHSAMFWLIGGQAKGKHAHFLERTPRAVTFNATLTLVTKKVYYTI